MNEEDILDKPIKKKDKMIPLNWLFYLASFFLLMRFIFHWNGWPYSNYLLIISGVCYEVFSLLRFLYYPNKTLFQRYSYLFFMIVIPGFIMDYLYMPEAKILLYASAVVPLLFFIHLGVNTFLKRRN